MDERDEDTPLDETLRDLPQILEGILLLDRLERPNPLAGKDIAVEGGPLNGTTQHNDGSHWQGDDWDVEVAGVPHRYRLGTRIRTADTTHLWFYKGHLDPAGVLVEPEHTAVPDADLTADRSPRPAPPHTTPKGSAMTAPDVDPIESADARLHDLVREHLLTVGISDAEQQAAEFVERVRAGRAKTPPDNDAQLWGASISGLSALPDQQPLIVARQLIAILRRVREPHRRTWGPGDELPSPPPAKMADLDWDVWMHQKAGHGCYRMSAADRRRNAQSIHDYEGVRVWPFLLDEEGPCTEVTSTQQRSARPVPRDGSEPV